MSRWEPNARGRLQQAALELYREIGFDNTTVAQIASHAGLTERTFFRHFRDKREVLFGGSSQLQEFLVERVTYAPIALSPIDAVADGLDRVAVHMFTGYHEVSRQRQAVIAANPELQERELIKLATLGAAVADALRARGVPDPTASLAAEAGIAAFKIAFARWTDGPAKPPLEEHIRAAIAELKSIMETRGTR